MDTLRGKDNTGVACIPKNVKDDVIVYKKAMDGADFLGLKKVQSLLYDVDQYRCVIGHNRWGTMGGKSDAAGHPFQYDHITLVHNGTMELWTGLDNTYDVDSEAICKAIATTSSVKKVLETLDGAFSLVWHNALDDTIHFARNKERPMCLAWSKDKRTMLFASESWMISELVSPVLGIDKVYTLAIGEHLTFSLDDEHLEAYSVEEFKPFPVTKPLDHSSWYNKYPKTNYQMGFGKGSGKQVANNNTQHATSSQLLQKYGYIVGDYIPFYSNSFSPYTNTDKGTIDGATAYVSTSSQFKVKAYGVSKLYHLSKEKLEGTIISAYKEGTTVILVVKDIIYYNSALSAETVVIPDVSFTGIVNSKGDSISVKEFELLAGKGCAMCTGEVVPEDSEYIDWTDDGRPFCLDCTSAAEVSTK